jgi:hypothetical protein
MTTSLSEGARLYLKDMDVLEEARQQLSDFFTATFEEVVAALPVVDRRVFASTGENWTCTASHWEDQQVTFEAPKSVFYVGITDPIMGDRPGFFWIWMLLTQGKQKELIRRRGAAVLTNLATERGVELSLTGTEQVVCSAWIDATSESAKELGGRLAETMRAFFEHATAFDKALVSEGFSLASTSKTTPAAAK